MRRRRLNDLDLIRRIEKPREGTQGFARSSTPRASIPKPFPGVKTQNIIILDKTLESLLKDFRLGDLRMNSEEEIGFLELYATIDRCAQRSLLGPYVAAHRLRRAADCRLAMWKHDPRRKRILQSREVAE